MYCSSCGSAVPQNLTYCNRCGAKVGGAMADGGNKPAEMYPNSLVNAVTAVFVFGLAAIVALMALMGNGPNFSPVILVAAMLSFVLTFLIESVLVWMLFRSRRGAREAGAAAVRPKDTTTQELAEAQERLLPDPVPSVTEHTTRTFDPVYTERKSK